MVEFKTSVIYIKKENKEFLLKLLDSYLNEGTLPMKGASNIISAVEIRKSLLGRKGAKNVD